MKPVRPPKIMFSDEATETCPACHSDFRNGACANEAECRPYRDYLFHCGETPRKPIPKARPPVFWKMAAALIGLTLVLPVFSKLAGG